MKTALASEPSRPSERLALDLEVWLFGSFGQELRSALSTVNFSPCIIKTASQGQGCEQTHGDDFSDSKPGTIPALCCQLVAPENRVYGGHLLSRAWLSNARPIKMILLEPRQPEKATSAQGMADPHKALIQLTMWTKSSWLSLCCVRCARAGAHAERLRVSHQREHL